MGLSHLGLYIKDIEVSKKFYTEVLGFSVTCEVTNPDGARLCFMRKGSCELEIVQHPVWMDRKDGIWDHVALQVEDIEAAKANLVANGVPLEDDIGFAPNIYNGMKYLMFRGPDGEHLEFDQLL